MNRLARHLRRISAPLRSSEHLLGAAATLLSGSLLAQVLVYLARPVLTRIYPPETFGLLTVFVAVTALLGTVATGRYVDAILLPEDEEEALPLIGVAGALLALVTLLSGLLGFYGGGIGRWFGQPDLGPWLTLVPVALAATGVLQIAETWYTRTEAFRPISATRVLQSVLTVTVQIAGGLLGGGAGALIGGHVGGYVGAALALGGLLALRRGSAVRAASSLRKMVRSARRYGRFLGYSAPAALLNNLGGRLPVLILLWFFDAETVAFYGLAHGSLAVPLTVVNGAVGQVFFARAPEADRTDRLVVLTRRTLRRLLALSLPATVLVIVAGPALFATIFGSEWTEAGRYARYLGAWIGLAAVASPLTRLFDVLEEQGSDLLFSTGMFVLHTGALLVGCGTGDPRAALLIYGVSGLLLRIAHLGVMLALAGVRPGALTSGLLVPLGGGLLWSAPVIATYAAGAPIGALAALGIGGLGYLWVFLRREAHESEGPHENEGP